MDSPTPTSKTSCRRRTLRRLLVLSVFLLFVLAAFMLSPTSRTPEFVWLTPAQAAQANRAGPLTLLRYKLMRMAGPLMRYYHGRGPNVMISLSMMVLPPTAEENASLGPPMYIDAEGKRAWVISPAELAALQQQLNTSPGVSKLMSPRIQTSDGAEAQMRTGSTINLAPGVSTNVGTTLDIRAKSSHGSVNLLLAVSSTSLGGPQTGSPAAILTNFSVACRVLVPEAGALVVNCGQPSVDDPANYWLIVSPVLLDATGKPVKP